MMLCTLHSLKLMTCLPQPPKCWDYKPALVFQLPALFLIGFLNSGTIETAELQVHPKVLQDNHSQ